MILFLLAIAAGVGVGALYGLLSMGLARRFGIVARPNRRSSHRRPTPRVGGIRFAVPMILYALAISLLMPLVYQWFETRPTLEMWDQWTQRFYFLAGAVGLGVFVFGLIDDARDTPAVFKLTWQALLALLTAGWLYGSLRALDLPVVGMVAVPPAAAFVFITVWILFVMNAYNFMDGINGLAALMGLGAAAGTALLLGRGYAPGHHLMLFWAVGGGALLAFWAVNQTGREFMGDCGSQFLGYVFAVAPLVWNDSWKVGFPWAAGGLMLLPFLYDVARTLLVRLMRGERLWEAHRDHLYQRLVKSGWPHGRIVMFNLPFYLICVSAGVAFAWQPMAGAKEWATAAAFGAMVVYHVMVVGMTRGVK